jgi:hypothetical protein
MEILLFILYIQKVPVVSCYLCYVTVVWLDYTSMFSPMYTLNFYSFCQPYQNQILLMISELQGISLYFLLSFRMWSSKFKLYPSSINHEKLIVTVLQYFAYVVAFMIYFLPFCLCPITVLKFLAHSSKQCSFDTECNSTAYGYRFIEISTCSNGSVNEASIHNRDIQYRDIFVER